MKKIGIFVVLVLALFMFTSCDKGENNANGNGNADEIVVDQDLKAEYQDLLKEKVVYLTTAGQADLDIVRNILTSAGLTLEDDKVNNLLKASDVETDAVVILVIGASGKGLGAAGTDVQAEVARTEAFGARQKADEITLIVVHVGGEGRTGAQSDPIITKAIPLAKLALVVDTDTKNQIFLDAVGSSDVELMFFSRATALVKPFKVLIGA